MPDGNGRRRESDIRSTTDPVPPEWESSIAPQGYEPEMVDDIAAMETPAQQRRGLVRWLVITLLLFAATFFFCIPRNAELPTGDPPPYNISQRPRPPTDVFVKDMIPKTVENYRLVHLEETQMYNEPFVGARAVLATFLSPDSQPVLVTMIDAQSDINARRYLRNYKSLLTEKTRGAEVKDLIRFDHSYVQWYAPALVDRGYGLAWSNGRFFLAVTSSNQVAQEGLAANFPY
jgi:hypothetical protein